MDWEQTELRNELAALSERARALAELTAIDTGPSATMLDVANTIDLT